MATNCMMPRPSTKTRLKNHGIWPLANGLKISFCGA